MLRLTGKTEHPFSISFIIPHLFISFSLSFSLRNNNYPCLLWIIYDEWTDYWKLSCPLQQCLNTLNISSDLETLCLSVSETCLPLSPHPWQRRKFQSVRNWLASGYANLNLSSNTKHITTFIYIHVRRSSLEFNNKHPVSLPWFAIVNSLNLAR